jgi:hypothetical protein
MKAIIASIDMIIGVLAFSLFFFVFLLNAVLSQKATAGNLGNEAGFLGIQARLQHSVFLIDRIGMNMSDAAKQLNYDVGPGNYSIVPFSSEYRNISQISRAVVIGNDVYYVEVHESENRT